MVQLIALNNNLKIKSIKKINVLKCLPVLLMAFVMQCRPKIETTVKEMLYLKTDNIFTGEVVQVHESNLPIVNKYENTDVVKVNKQI